MKNIALNMHLKKLIIQKNNDHSTTSKNNITIIFSISTKII